jgi:peptidyl-prolyl cis-trans isomerase D
MMQEMRGYAKSWIAYLFVIPLAVSFGIWGIGDFLRTSAPDTSVATVGDTKIEPGKYQRDFRNLQRRASNQEHRQVTNEELHAKGLDRQLVQEEIGSAALDQAAAQYGIMATDGAVSGVIRSQAAFRNPLGAFDHTTFEQLLAQNGLTEDEYIALIRGELTRNQLLGAATNGMQMPAGYAKLFFAFLNERRAAEYVKVSAQALPPTRTPTNAELTAYLKAHAAQFSTPEYRDITYLSATPDDLGSQFKVSDAQLKQAYDEKKDQFQIPEKRDVEQIKFSDEASAKAARARIDKGAKFEDVASSLGQSADDIKLGSVVQADLGADRGPPAFALPSGGISQPVKFTFGWVLMRVTSITPAVNKTFDQEKDTLRKQAVAQLAVAKITDIDNAFQDARAGGASFAEAGQHVGMKVTHIPQVDKNGLTPDGKKADLPQSPEFQAQLARAEVGEEGDPFQAADGSSFAIKINGETPSKIKSLDSVRAQVTAAWTQDQREEQLAGLAASLTQKANSDRSLKAVAAQLHTNVQSTGGLSRNTQSDVVSQELLKKIFSAPAGSAVSAPESDGSFVVARVTGVNHPDLGPDNPMYQRLGAELGNEAGQDLGSALAHAWRDKLGVKINQSEVDRLAGGS